MKDAVTMKEIIPVCQMKDCLKWRYCKAKYTYAKCIHYMET